MQNRKKAVALNYDGANAPIVTAVGMGIISVFVIVGINYMMEPKEFKELILRVKGIVRR